MEPTWKALWAYRALWEVCWTLVGPNFLDWAWLVLPFELAALPPAILARRAFPGEATIFGWGAASADRLASADLIPVSGSAGTPSNVRGGRPGGSASARAAAGL